MSATNRKPARGRQAAFVLLAVVALGSGFLDSSRAAPTGPDRQARSDPSDELFTNSPIPHVFIEINATNMAALRKDKHRYVRATIKEGGQVWEEVGLHLKGSAGSVRELDDNPALTLNFDKYVDRQKFHGLDKIHLNNSVQDASFTTELLCGEMFRAAGVPAARTTHARVTLNGRDVGLYVLKEGFDKTFLRRYWKNTKGNFYDGGFLREITDGAEKISGPDPKDQSDLKRLAEAALEPDPATRMERLSQLLDMDQFLAFTALEIMIWDWDGYPLKHNNYRMYHDPDSDKITFIPHGMDQMFWEPNGPVLPLTIYSQLQGLVCKQVLQTVEGKRRYREKVSMLLTNVFRVEALTNRVLEVQARIRPVLASIHPNKAKEHDGQVQRIISLITQRAAGIERQLSLPEPKPVSFGPDDLASLSGWRIEQKTGDAVLEQTTDSQQRKTLHIRAGADAKCTASWRATALLNAGTYRFEGLVRTAGVEELDESKSTIQKGKGAGLRIHDSRKPRPFQALGDTEWQKAEYEVLVPEGPAEIEFICELRATKGEAWFDTGSLKLRKVK